MPQSKPEMFIRACRHYSTWMCACMIQKGGVHRTFMRETDMTASKILPTTERRCPAFAPAVTIGNSQSFSSNPFSSSQCNQPELQLLRSWSKA